MLGQVPVRPGERPVAVLQRLEHEPEFGRMERALHVVRARLVVRQGVGELIGIDRLAGRIPEAAETADPFFRIAHVVPRVADHVGDVLDPASLGGGIETFQRQIAVHHGPGREPERSAGLGDIAVCQRENVFGGGGTHLLQGVIAGPVEQFLRDIADEGQRSGGLRGGGRSCRQRVHAATALDDRLLDQVAGQRRGNERFHAAGTGALAQDRDVIRVSAERGDVGMDPLECGDLVQKTIIAGNVVRALLRQEWMDQEPEDPEPIVDSDQDDALFGPGLAVEFGLIAPAAGIGSAVDPHGHRQFLLRFARGRRPDVQVQAVLAEFRVLPVEFTGPGVAGVMFDLHRTRAESIGLPHPFPRNDGLGLLPAQIPDGRGGERDSFIDIDPFGGRFDSLDLSALDLENGIGGTASCQRDGQHHGRQK